MTDLISRSSYDTDIWLQRGCGTGAIESFLGISNGTLSGMSQKELDEFVDFVGRDYSFRSTAVSKGKGFSGQVIMNIYAPKGTQMMYAEPFSAYGSGGGLSWDGISKQTNFGRESEMIIQRGAIYKVNKIEKANGKIYIDLEVHPEKGYELIQQNPAEWKGKKDKFQ